jgi:hypothetical protein
MTIQDKLKAIVEKMVEGGWPEFDKPTELTIRVFSKLDMRIAIETSPKFWIKVWEGTFPDLLCNPAAMGALFGEGKICPLCGESRWDKIGGDKICRMFCPGMSFSPIEKHVHHGMTAAKISLTEGIESAIDYLFKEGCK